MGRVQPKGEFLTGARLPEQFPRSDVPEVAFAGRSNVGKSSLLNAVLRRRALAKTSSTPGKTREINFFNINDGLCRFVDLPGYGYAKVSKSEREIWQKIIESYLTDREQLRLVISLVDIRHDPSPLDLQLFEWLEALERPFLVVLTKSDKVKKGQVADRISQIEESTDESRFFRGVVPFSVKNAADRISLFDRILKILRSS